MSWIKLDDGFFRHPKVVEVGRDGRLLFIAGLCYCGGMLTDGFIPNGALRGLAADAEITKVQQATERLVAVGLWESCDGGFWVHDYLDYNTASEKVQGERAAARERMKRKRSENVRPNNSRSSPNVRQPETEVETEVETETDLTPVVPNAETPKNGRAAPIYTEDFLAFWTAYPKGHGNKQTAFTVWQQLKPNPETQAEILAGVDRWKQSRKWKDKFVRDAERFLKLRMWEDEVEPVPLPPLPPDLQKRVETVDAEQRYRNEPTGIYPDQLQRDIERFYASIGGN